MTLHVAIQVMHRIIYYCSYTLHKQPNIKFIYIWILEEAVCTRNFRYAIKKQEES